MIALETLIDPHNKIVFCNFAGKGYGGYPKDICDELINRDCESELIWLVNDIEGSGFPEQVKLVDINSYSALKELATAKVWIDNCRKPGEIRKSKKQFYLQTWHGGGPCLKMIEGDAEPFLSKSYIKAAKNDTKMADLFISDCRWQNENYRRAFWYDGEILNCTTPPNDLFYQDWTKVKHKVFSHFHLDEKTHIVLYAPTFRNNHSTDFIGVDSDIVISSCKKRFGGDWKLMLRIHPTMSEAQEKIVFNEDVINGTEYPQIEDLLIASDVLITDFSASMFLAFRWNIPTFLYANDYEEYIHKERPLYFDVKDLPADFSHSNSELKQQIESFSIEKYKDKCIAFSQEVGFFEGGKATKTITDRIEEVLN